MPKRILAVSTFDSAATKCCQVVCGDLLGARHCGRWPDHPEKNSKSSKQHDSNPRFRPLAANESRGERHFASLRRAISVKSQPPILREYENSNRIGLSQPLSRCLVSQEGRFPRVFRLVQLSRLLTVNRTVDNIDPWGRTTDHTFPHLKAALLKVAEGWRPAQSTHFSSSFWHWSSWSVRLGLRLDWQIVIRLSLHFRDFGPF